MPAVPDIDTLTQALRAQPRFADRVALYLRPETLRRMRAEWLGTPGLDRELASAHRASRSRETR
jgi:hypothetical protein